jgi:hypothetical protein
MGETHEDVVYGDDVVSLLRLLLQLLGHLVVRSTLGETTSRLRVIFEVSGQVGSALDVVVDVLRMTSYPQDSKINQFPVLSRELSERRKLTEPTTTRGDGRPKSSCLAC